MIITCMSRGDILSICAISAYVLCCQLHRLLKEHSRYRRSIFHSRLYLTGSNSNRLKIRYRMTLDSKRLPILAAAASILCCSSEVKVFSENILINSESKITDIIRKYIHVNITRTTLMSFIIRLGFSHFHYHFFNFFR